MVTDPGYSAYFGGPANVTAAKVALMNRVNQIYEDDLTIRMQFIANNDLLNLNTYDLAVAPNGPCGVRRLLHAGAGARAARRHGNRIVISQIIGASNYDVGHLALGQPGGGVAQPRPRSDGRTRRRAARASRRRSATSSPSTTSRTSSATSSPGNHTFNGNQLNCSGGNRSQAHSVEPGSGSSVQAYAGICATDNLQPHSDPYFSQRSQQEMTTFAATTTFAPLNEVQTVSLRHFGGGDEVQIGTLGPGFSAASTVHR